MMRHLVIATMLLLTVVAIADEPVAVPGTTVIMIPPGGFEFAEGYLGFVSYPERSKIMITEFPSMAYEGMSSLFVDLPTAQEGFVAQGITITDREIWTVGGERMPVLIGRQSSVSGTARKYIMVLDGEMTVMVTIDIYDTARYDDAAIKAAVTSIELAVPLTLEQKLAELPFTFDVVEPFQIHSILRETSVTLRLPENASTVVFKPMIRISQDSEHHDPSSLESLAEELFDRVKGMRDMQVTVKQATPFAGGAGYLLQAESVELTLVQYVRITADGPCIELLARGDGQALSDLMPVLEAVALSVKPRD